jgi:hypothetical protein
MTFTARHRMTRVHPTRLPTTTHRRLSHSMTTSARLPERGGRTSWWPCDAAEHDRELVVELGEEFGPAAHALTRIMKDLAQAQRDAGNLRTGFRVLAAKAHLMVQTGDPASARDLARQIVERAGEIGWMDDLRIDPDGRRFSCRISGWDADGVRGRAAIKKAEQRALSPQEGTTAPVVPQKGDVSPVVPLNRTEQTIEVETPAAVVARAAAPSAFDDVMAIVTEAGITSPDLDMTVMRVLDAYPHANHRRAVNLAVNDMRSGRRTTPHFYQAFSDRCKDQESEAPKLSEKEQRAAADLAALERLMQGSSDAVA